MKKNVKWIFYKKLANDVRYLALSPTPEIYWKLAPQWSPNPCIVINRIAWWTTRQWLRMDLFQISIWSETEIEAEEIKNTVVDIYNRIKKSDWIDYCWLVDDKDIFDEKIGLHGIHLRFKLKIYDPEY